MYNVLFLDTEVLFSFYELFLLSNNWASVEMVILNVSGLCYENTHMDKLQS